MKRKFNIFIGAVIFLGLCLFLTWSYLKPVDSSIYTKFIGTLEQYGYNVEDVTKQYIKDNPTTNLSNDQRLIDVTGERFCVTVGKASNIDSILKKAKLELTNPLGDFKNKPLLYKKGYLIVSYVGEDNKLIKTLEELLGKSLLN